VSELSQISMAARECLKKNLPHAQTMSLAREIRKLDTVDEFRLIRLSVLSSSNLDFLAPLLEVTAFTDRILLKTQTAGFNQIDQYILDPGSPLYLFSPNFALIAARPEDIVPNLAYNLELVDDQVIDGWIDEIRTKLNTWCASLTKAKVQIIFLSFARPAYSPLGIRDFSHPKGHVRIWNRLNELLTEVVGQY
jgi:predicted enzyme involved in methoxymalonyl-ACP biosynthesis